MALTAKQIADLNNAMTANKRANLGTVVSDLTDASSDASGDIIALQAQVIRRGSYTAVAGDDTAGSKVIATGLATAIVGWQVEIYRANVRVGGDVVVTAASANLTVADGSTYKITADDKIYWLVW